jgi:hypothetical protein
MDHRLEASQLRFKTLENGHESKYIGANDFCLYQMRFITRAVVLAAFMNT